jgi:hypothetical protein
VGFDQHVHGQVLAAGLGGVGVDQFDGVDFGHAVHLGHHDVGQALGGGADDFDIARKERAVHIVHAGADAVEFVLFGLSSSR